MFWLTKSNFRVFRADVTMSVSSPSVNTGREAISEANFPAVMSCDMFPSSTCDTFLTRLHQGPVVWMQFGCSKIPRRPCGCCVMQIHANTRFKHLGPLVSPQQSQPGLRNKEIDTNHLIISQMRFWDVGIPVAIGFATLQTLPQSKGDTLQWIKYGTMLQTINDICLKLHL